MENPTMSNPAAGAATPNPGKNDFQAAMKIVLEAMRPVLAKMPREQRRALTRELSRLNHVYAFTRESDASRGGRNGYEAIVKKVQDRNHERNLEPSEKALEVPDLDATVMKESKMVFICAPVIADNEEERQRNMNHAASLSRFACSRGMIPVTPLLMLSAFLDDDDPAENSYGMFCALQLLGNCDEVWVMDVDGVSGEMAFEIWFAKKNGIPVKYCTLTKEEDKE